MLKATQKEDNDSGKPYEEMHLRLNTISTASSSSEDYRKSFKEANTEPYTNVSSKIRTLHTLTPSTRHLEHVLIPLGKPKLGWL